MLEHGPAFVVHLSHCGYQRRAADISPQEIDRRCEMQGLRRGLHLDRTEAPRIEKPPDLARIVQREHLPHEPGDLGFQMPCEGLLKDGEDLRCGARNVDEEPSSRLEDAVHLS